MKLQSKTTSKALCIFILSAMILSACHNNNDSNYSLADFGETSYPTANDSWIICDRSADADDFAGVSSAIETLAKSERKISLEFTEIESIPDFAIFGQKLFLENYLSSALHGLAATKATSVGVSAFAYCAALSQIDLPAATTIGQAAFYDCKTLSNIKLPRATTIGDYSFCDCCSIQRVDLPKVTKIGKYSFAHCTNITQISLATKENVKLESIADEAFYNTPTETITLYIGVANSEYINANRLTINDLSVEFKNIVII